MTTQHAGAHPTSHRVITTAGHVDHGKSSLVRQLTGMEPDRLAEERRRGLSIELGFVWGRPDPHGPLLAFVDVPGHERFIATMLAGSGPSPAALLVVAADDGWSAQTTEHFQALDLLAIPGVAIAITKRDLVDANRLDEVAANIRDRTRETAWASTPIVAVDAVGGDGVDELARVITTRLRHVPPPPDHGRPRLWVDRVFSAAGSGTVVTGTLEGGPLAVDQHLHVWPARHPARIRGLQQLGQPTDRAAIGARVAVNIAGLHRDQIRRGDALTARDDHWRQTRRFVGAVRILPDRQIGTSGAWHLHTGTTHVTCRIRVLDTALVGDTDRSSTATVIAEVTLERPLPLTTGDRFVLRDAGRRLLAAGGTVIDPSGRPLPPRRHLARYAATVAALGDTTGTHRLVGLAELSGGAVRRAELLADANWHQDRPLPTPLAAAGDWVTTANVRRTWAQTVAALGAGVHSREALVARLEGLPAAHHGLDGPARRQLAAAAIDALTAAGTVVRRAGGYTLAEHAEAATHAVTTRQDQFLAQLDRQGLAPERLETLAARHGIDHRQLSAMAQRGELILLGDFALTPAAIRRAVATLASTFGDTGQSFTATAAKQAWATTRKFAIPLLEHLDRTGVTVFDGQLRTMSAARRHQSPPDC